VKWLFLDVIPADTNGDKSLTDADKDADKKVLATADADGSHYIGVWLGSIDTVFRKDVYRWRGIAGCVLGAEQESRLGN